jgi:SprT protein
MKFLFPDVTPQAKALAKIEECKEMARARGWELPEDIGCSFLVYFNLNSIRTAGFAHYKIFAQEMSIRLHAKALEYYGQEYIDRTVVHEFAHIIQYVNFPNASAHGRDFKRIMRAFGSPGTRCHNYDLETVTGKTRKRQMRINYSCDCQNHMITTTKHNKILKGANYICRSCKTRLVKA